MFLNEPTLLYSYANGWPVILFKKIHLILNHHKPQFSWLLLEIHMVLNPTMPCICLADVPTGNAHQPVSKIILNADA